MAKILVVESESALLSVLSEELDQAGYEVDMSVTGAEALRKVENKPDAIILDGRLSDADGLVFLAKIKAETSTKGIPVILLLESGDDERAISANEMGVAMSIVKTRNGLKNIMAGLQTVLSQ